jgi:hypothetical protein
MIFVGLAFAASAGPKSLAQQKTDAGEKYALLVGVRKYDPNELRALPYSEPDVVELAGVLKANGYKPGNVVLMTQTLGAEDTRFLPIVANIRKELKLLLEHLDEKDAALIAFAGHGIQFQGDEESYFCPADAKLADKSTLIPLSEIYKALEQSQAGLKVLLVDACRDDPQSQNSRDRQVVNLESVTRPQRKSPPGGVVAFFSCSDGQKAFEHADLKHGVFFHFVIDALRGAAIGPDQNEVLVPDLVKYVTRRVKDFVREKYGVDQLPEWKGTSRDLLPLASLSRTKPLKVPTTTTLAIGLRPIGMRLAGELKRPPSQPQTVFVVPGGGGDRVGLKAGDMVLQVDGWDVAMTAQAVDAIGNRDAGARIGLTVARAGKEITLSGLYENKLLDSQIIGRVRQLAERGDVEAQLYMGICLAEGRFTTKDEAEAVTWFRKAAEKGHGDAQHYLGLMYDWGRGVSKDDGEAVSWYRRAAEQGVAVAESNLGGMYADGRGVPKDDSQAVAWYRRSAEQADPWGQNRLGWMYREGRGVGKDDKEAVSWFRKAADQGNTDAHDNLNSLARFWDV